MPVPYPVLTVPNWSCFLDEDVRSELEAGLAGTGVQVHDFSSNRDHGRTVAAFGGDWSEVVSGLNWLSEQLLPRIDLRQATGVHPRLGALDVCPFVAIGMAEADLLQKVPTFARDWSTRFGVPVEFYEKSGSRSLPEVRKLGKAGLATRWGQATMGVRDFLLAFNLNSAHVSIEQARGVARQIRHDRDAGDRRLAGVRCLAFSLAHRGMVQLSFNVTQPDRVSLDDLVDLVEGAARVEWEPELIGVIRDVDLAGALKVPVRAAQIVVTRGRA